MRRQDLDEVLLEVGRRYPGRSVAIVGFSCGSGPLAGQSKGLAVMTSELCATFWHSWYLRLRWPLRGSPGAFVRLDTGLGAKGLEGGRSLSSSLVPQ